MIVRSELYFPDIEFELPDPPVPVSEQHAVLAQKLKDKLNKKKSKKSHDPNPPKVRYSESPLWTWPDILRGMDGKLTALRDRFGVDLPMERVDIELVRRASLVAAKGKSRAQLVDAYGAGIVNSVVGIHNRSANGMHSIRVGYYGEQYSKTRDQVEGTLTHELGHVYGELPLFGVLFEEMKGYTFQALLMGKPEQAVGSTGSVIHDNSRRMLAQLGGMGICEPAILAHLSGVSFGEYSPRSYRDLRRF